MSERVSCEGGGRTSFFLLRPSDAAAPLETAERDEEESDELEPLLVAEPVRLRPLLGSVFLPLDIDTWKLGRCFSRAFSACAAVRPRPPGREAYVIKVAVAVDRKELVPIVLVGDV